MIEVDVGHAARQGASRYSPLRLTRLALHVLAGFWPQPIQWAGVVLGFVCTLAATVLGIYAVAYWIGESDFPGPLLPRSGGDLRARRAGLRARPRRGVPRAASSARSRAGRCTPSSASCSRAVSRRDGQIATSRRDCSREGSQGTVGSRASGSREACRKHRAGGATVCSSTVAPPAEARSRHRRRRVHLVQRDPPPAGEHGLRGGLARLAHLRREPREPRRRARSRAPLVRPRRHPGRLTRRRSRRRGRRDRQRGRRVPRREVDRGRRLRVRDDERRRHADPARRDPPYARRAVHPHLLERGVRHGRDRPDGRAPSARAAEPLRRDEGRRRPARLQLLRHLRPADRDRAAVQQLRPAPASREGRAALHHAGALRRRR